MQKRKRKIEGTLELAEGLLLVANMVDAPGARDNALSAMGADGGMPAKPKISSAIGQVPRKSGVGVLGGGIGVEVCVGT